MSTKQYTFIDLFAGAGGFSEGFLQSENGSKFYKFLLASDINENCEVTHVVRYRHQLGIKDNEFLCKDITDNDFIHQLKEKLNGKEVDVITGGPPCQSFSLAGRRRTFDKKDDLFISYLNIVRELKPKYFVMENVKGILTKYDGLVIERIKREIKEILDESKVNSLDSSIQKFIKASDSLTTEDKNKLTNILLLLRIMSLSHNDRHELIKEYFKTQFQDFSKSLPKFATYHMSKSDIEICTIRHGLNMLMEAPKWKEISKLTMKTKSLNDIDNDHFVNKIDSFLNEIEPENILKTIQESIERVKHNGHLNSLQENIELYTYSIEEYINEIIILVSCDPENKYYTSIINILQEGLNLYNIEDPMVLLASDYGVPQNRERVIFLGSRTDQREIKNITKTTPTKEEKVTILEALHDLDNIGINEVVTDYKSEFSEARKFNLKFKKYIRKRNSNGEYVNASSHAKTYAEWSRTGRLNPKRFNIKDNFFCENYNEYNGYKDISNLRFIPAKLHNHQTSNHSEEVQRRLSIIRKHGDYKEAMSELEKLNLASKKRNYNPFSPTEQSTTIMTLADDYIHYRANRAPTVREMARLQSFDDSFVFQGKRTTGGNRRKDEIPQLTLVGNAVPPLMARAIADEILKYID